MHDRTTGGETPPLRGCLNHGKQGFEIVELLCRIGLQYVLQKRSGIQINGMNACGRSPEFKSRNQRYGIPRLQRRMMICKRDGVGGDFRCLRVQGGSAQHASPTHATRLPFCPKRSDGCMAQRKRLSTAPKHRHTDPLLFLTIATKEKCGGFSSLRKTFGK